MHHAEKISVTVTPRLEAIRARVHRSIDDPRPSLDEDEDETPSLNSCPRKCQSMKHVEIADRPDAVDHGEAAGLSIREYSDALAQDFHDINAQWIEAMFAMEPADREVLEQPQARIIAPGGAILFVEANGLGIVGTCALRKTSEQEFELTKMGVLESARGRKAGEFLLRAALRRAGELGAERLYLLTNSKLGFAHDAEIMRDFGSRYARCDVAMRYRPGQAR
jgi:GNAT superfamily N-acetyltransferase